MEDFVLLLQEVAYHPNSYLTKIMKNFELTSIVQITKKEELRKYSKPPLFDEKYLILFEDIKIFSENKAFLSFKLMFPVLHIESATALDEAIALCRESDIPYKIFRNAFLREDAFSFIQEKASVPVSDKMCKAIVRQVGLNPIRITTAVGVCEQLGYKESIIDRYVDKWIYPDVRKVIECLLGVPRNRSAVRNALMYLHLNRFWYKYTKRVLLDEIECIFQVYRDKLDGKIGSDQVFSYIEASNITRSRVMFALSLYERVSISSILVLREFIKTATLLELVLRLNMVWEVLVCT